MAMEACSDDLPIDDNCGSSSDAKDDNDDDAVAISRRGVMVCQELFLSLSLSPVSLYR